MKKDARPLALSFCGRLHLREDRHRSCWVPSSVKEKAGRAMPGSLVLTTTLFRRRDGHFKVYSE